MTTNQPFQVETWWSKISNQDQLHLIHLEYDGWRVLSKGLFEAIGKVGGQTSTLDILGPEVHTLFPREWDWIREQGRQPSFDGLDGSLKFRAPPLHDVLPRDPKRRTPGIFYRWRAAAIVQAMSRSNNPKPERELPTEMPKASSGLKEDKFK